MEVLSIRTMELAGVGPASELHGEAFLVARTTRRPAYGMFYVALARREDATLLTTDIQLRRQAERQCIRVV